MSDVVLGMSGGVDSCAAAILLKEKGYNVIALYFDVFGNKNSKEYNNAKYAAESLDIEFVYKDCSREFDEKIINYFCSEYKNGRTPTPCVFCNPLIKFKVLSELNTDYIATGHYAGITEIDDIFFVRKAANTFKDQSYMLSRLPQDILSKTLFPLSEITTKEETRNIVREKGIQVSESKDSQDICFISGSYKDFLKEKNIVSLQGNFVHENGEIIAPHKGIANYTIGQRKGLGVALCKPAFISKIDSVSGNITLTSDESLLFTDTVEITDLFINADIDDKPYHVKLRYAAAPAECLIEIKNDTAKLHFKDKQRAATPGQAAVIYREDIVIGSGIIYN